MYQETTTKFVLPIAETVEPSEGAVSAWMAGIRNGTLPPSRTSAPRPYKDANAELPGACSPPQHVLLVVILLLLLLLLWIRASTQDAVDCLTCNCVGARGD